MVEINYDACTKPVQNSQTEFKRTVLNSYINGKGIITVVGEGANKAGKEVVKSNKQVIFKGCVPFTVGISEMITM